MLKAKFGKYKAAEVDKLLAENEKANAEALETLQKQVESLQAENSELKAQIENYKSREGCIASVMLDATKHAKQIEDDYRQRAADSDAACQKLHDEWVSGIQSASENLARLRAEAKATLESIDGQFASLCEWADSGLTALSDSCPAPSLTAAEEASAEPVQTVMTDVAEEVPAEPATEDAALEAEIAKGAGTDLEEVCRDLGLMNDDQEQ